MTADLLRAHIAR